MFFFCLWTTSLILLSSTRINGDVVHLASNNISQYLENHVTFVKFYSHWCPHSKKFEPIWNEFSQVKQNKDVQIAKVDCSREALLCSDHDVFGYPTLKLFVRGSGARYEGPRDVNALETFYRQKLTEDATAEDSIAVKNLITELTTENFLSTIKQNFVFAMFFAPWCKHCQILKPTFEDLARQMGGTNGLTFASVDCTKQASLCTSNAIQGYPTLIWFENGDEKDRYVDRRDVTTMRKFIEEKMKQTKPIVVEGPPPVQNDDPIENSALLSFDHLLTTQTFTKGVSFEGYAFVNFGAPWCSHCQRLLPIWRQLSKRFEPFEEIRILRVDCTASESLCRDYGIRAFPTLILFRYGESKVEYNASRDLESLFNFVVNQLEFFGDEYLLNLDDKETPNE